MTGIDKLIECQPGHLAGILRAEGQAGEQLSTQTLDLLQWEKRLAQCLSQ
jgi:hypothetical protein